MQLLGELPGVEITDSGGLNFRRISLCVIERFLSGFGDEMPDCRIVLPSFFRLRLKSVRPPPRM